VNNNTKSKFKKTNNKIRAAKVREANPRSPYNKKGKVAAKIRNVGSFSE
jgi:hypothetical protein